MYEICKNHEVINIYLTFLFQSSNVLKRLSFMETQLIKRSLVTGDDIINGEIRTNFIKI